MKPHPRIRRTIKWGGLAVCILLAGLWAASERWRVHGYQQPWAVGLYPGRVILLHAPQTVYRMPPGWSAGVHVPGVAREWWVRWDRMNGGTRLIIPLWMPLTLAAASTATAWRLDTLARRRASTHACAKCGYDRAGLAADSKCPECGSAPSIA